LIRAYRRTRTAGPRDALFRAELLGRKRRQQIDLVDVGDGQHQFRLVDARLAQNVGIGSVALEGLDVERIADALEVFRAQIDDDHLMLLHLEQLADVAAHRARADDDDLER
jgi:hypothetical protein